MSQVNLKLTHQEAVVKVWGNGIDDTIVLADLLATNQVVDTTADAYQVNITSVTWTGSTDSTISIQRDGETIMTLPCSQAGNSMELDGQQLPPDTVNNYSDIYISSNGDAQLYITLRKKVGYKSTVEYAEYGSYDAEDIIGAQRISGAPIPDAVQGLPDPGSGGYNNLIEVDTSESGTPYAEGYYFSDPFPTVDPTGLYRRSFAGNFATNPGDTIDVNFCRNTPSWNGVVDSYAGFGNQDLENKSNYTFEWTGWFRAPADGTYNFWLESDDDSYMWFGQNALNDNNDQNNYVVSTSNSTTKTSNSIQLTQGMYYPVRIQYGEWSGAEKCQVYWARVEDNASLAYAGNVGENTTVWYYNTDTNGI